MNVLVGMLRSPTVAAVLFVSGIALLQFSGTSTGQVWRWSQTAGTNATVDPSINYAEGQSPSSINDSARATMAGIAKWRDDLNGTVTTGGTSTAFTAASNQVLTAFTAGHRICFAPNATNGGTTTINVDGLGAKPLRSAPATELGSGVLVQGTPYCATYFTSNSGEYILESFYGNPFNVPIGSMMPYTASTAPNSNFVLPFGQAISRTTYATYFSLIGTTYGVGDGSSTFNVIDMRGRAPLGQDTMGGSAANRIGVAVTDAGTITGANLGSSGGSANHAISVAEMPSHSHTITDPGHAHGTSQSPGNAIVGNTTSVAVQGGAAAVVPNNATSLSLTVNSASTGITGTNSSGSGNGMSLLQPSIITTYILRVF